MKQMYYKVPFKRGDVCLIYSRKNYAFCVKGKDTIHRKEELALIL